MRPLTAQNAQSHCCTCLVNFDDPMETHEVNNSPAFVNLVENPNILNLLKILVKTGVSEIENYPQNICIVCFRVLEEIEEFRQNVIECVAKLRSLLGHKNILFERIEVPKIITDEIREFNGKLIENNQLDENENTLSDSLNDYNTDSKIMKLNQCEKSISKPFLELNDSDDQNDYLQDNIRTTQPSQFKTFKCHLCKIDFIQLPEYLKHIRQVHRNCKIYDCEFCDKSYKSFDSLRKHLDLVHDRQGEPIKCTDCNKLFKTKASLKQHRLHTHYSKDEVDKNTDYVCEQCHAPFRKAISLAYHYLTKHSEDASNPALKFKCYVCDKSFQNIFNLDEHTVRFHVKERHSDDIVNYEYRKKFKCDQCGRHYARKYDVVEHVRSIHCKIKAFKCQECKQSFATANTLQHHMYRHTGEKPYVCDICDKAFRQPTPMKVHRRSHQQ